jgi:geranylgeranyl diphosphate synthase type I
MGFKTDTVEMLPKIEVELKNLVYLDISDSYIGVKEMMAYHLGWEGEQAGLKAQGKRIRPLIVLLSTILCNGTWQKALPAAASIELLHNFSLIHDDIEDRSELRRGRPTLWCNYGVPQAINTGDAMFALAHISMLKLGNTIDIETAFEAMKLLDQTCLVLTGGQYLDMHFENEKVVSLQDYNLMIEGKTAALLATTAELGAIISKSSLHNRNNLRSFGKSLGIAFQCWDDWLGIWGDEKQTGKSISSDLISGKKTLPILYALEKKGSFNKLNNLKAVNEGNIHDFVRCLEDDGAKDFTEQLAQEYTGKAIQSLNSVDSDNPKANKALIELTNSLLKRNK